MVALILYLSFYLCPLPYDFKSPPTKKQRLFPCSLSLSLVASLALANRILAVMTQNLGKVSEYFLCSYASSIPWRMGNTWSMPICPGYTSQNQPISVNTR